MMLYAMSLEHLPQTSWKEHMRGIESIILFRKKQFILS
jgi:hypothetical protein